MSRHPTVEVISRIALDAAAPLDLTIGAISLAVMTVGIVVLARRSWPGPGSAGRSTWTRQRRIIPSGWRSFTLLRPRLTG